MAGATLMDVFNAGTRATAPFLQHETNRLREQNDLELRNFQARFATDLQNRIRNNPFNGNAESYYAGILKFADEKFSAARAANTSPYFQRNLDQMRTQSQELIRNHVLQQEDAWRISYEAANFSSDIQAYSEAGWDPQRTQEAVNNRIELSRTRRQMSPEEVDRLRRGAERAVFEKKAVEALSQITDVNRLEGTLESIRAQFQFLPRTEAPVYDNQRNRIGTEMRPWGFEGQAEWEKALIEQETMRIQGEHWERINQAQAFMERLVVSGNLEGAIEHARVWGARWNRAFNPDNPEHTNISDADRYRGRRFFDIRTLEGLLAQEARLCAGFYVNPASFIRATLDRNSTVTLYSRDGAPMQVNFENFKDARDSFIYRMIRAFEHEHRDSDKSQSQLNNLLEYQITEWYQRFHSDLLATMRELSPELLDAYRKFQNFSTFMLPEISGGRENPYFYPGLADRDITHQEKLTFAQSAVSFFVDLAMTTRPDPVEWSRRMEHFTSEEITRHLEWRRTPDRSGGNYWMQRAEWSRRAMEEGGLGEDVVWTDREGRVQWRNEETERWAENMRETERGDIARILGIDISLLNPDWMRSQTQSRDIIPKGIFTVRSGPMAGTYHMDYDESGNPLVLRQIPTTGAWIVIHRSERPPSTGENIGDFFFGTGRDRRQQNRQSIGQYTDRDTRGAGDAAQSHRGIDR